jgi:hypothetical protein
MITDVYLPLRWGLNARNLWEASARKMSEPYGRKAVWALFLLLQPYLSVII